MPNYTAIADALSHARLTAEIQLGKSEDPKLDDHLAEAVGYLYDAYHRAVELAKELDDA